MGPELSRRLGAVLGSRTVPMAVRLQVIADAGSAQTWDDLPEDTKRLIEDLERDDDEASAVEPDTARSLLAAFDRGSDPDPSLGEIASWARAAGADTHPGGDDLHDYWTKSPEGLAKWATLPEGRWTALFNQLKKHMSPDRARRVASAWFEETIGYAAGSDKNLVASGKPPRGEKVGPG